MNNSVIMVDVEKSIGYGIRSAPDVSPCLGIGIADNFLGIASSNERYFLGISSSFKCDVKLKWDKIV